MTEVRGEDSGGEAEPARARARQRLFERGDPPYGRDGSERLLGEHRHLVRAVVEHRGWVEAARPLDAPPARHQPSAGSDGGVHVSGHHAELPFIDQRPQLRRLVVRRADHHRLGAACQLLDEGVGHRLVHIDPLDGRAELARVGERPDGDLLCCPLGIDAGVHDQRVLAAVLQKHPRPPCACRDGDAAAGSSAADVCDQRDAVVGHECLTRLAVTVDDVEHTWGQALSHPPGQLVTG